MVLPIKGGAHREDIQSAAFGFRVISTISISGRVLGPAQVMKVCQDHLRLRAGRARAGRDLPVTSGLGQKLRRSPFRVSRRRIFGGAALRFGAMAWSLGYNRRRSRPYDGAALWHRS